MKQLETGKHDCLTECTDYTDRRESPFSRSRIFPLFFFKSFVFSTVWNGNDVIRFRLKRKLRVAEFAFTLWCWMSLIQRDSGKIKARCDARTHRHSQALTGTHRHALQSVVSEMWLNGIVDVIKPWNKGTEPNAVYTLVSHNAPHPWIL